MEGGSIYQNGLKADQSGTAIYNTGTLYISGGSIYDNYTTKTGAVNTHLGGTIYMSGGSIYNNTAVGNGGGMHISTDSYATLTGGYIYGNTSKANGQDVYNANSLTIGKVAIGYDENGNYQGGELYFASGLNPVLQGTEVWHTAS